MEEIIKGKFKFLEMNNYFNINRHVSPPISISIYQNWKIHHVHLNFDSHLCWKNLQTNLESNTCFLPLFDILFQGFPLYT